MNKAFRLLIFAFLVLLTSCTEVAITQPNRNTKVGTNLVESPTILPTTVSTTITIVSTHTVTPTPSSSATPSVTSTSQNTIELSSTQVVTTTADFQTLPPGLLYSYESLLYGFVDPRAGLQYSLIPVYSESDEVEDPHGSAVSLAFSHYSQQVAYLTNSEKLSLWLGSIDLEDVDLLWVDEADWLKYDPANYDEIEMRFGPGDQSILLRNREHHVVISLQDGRATLLANKCAWVGISPRTRHLSIGCPTGDENQAYVIVEQDGAQWRTPVLADNGIEAQDFLFSSDGDEALVATLQDELIILNSSDEKRVLPICYAPPRWDIVMRVLQWSKGGRQILVYGFDRQGHSCPANSGSERPGWLLLDAETSEIIWRPDGLLSYSDFDAALSPDGEWIVMSVMDVPDRYAFVVSLSTNEMIRVYYWVLSPVVWVDQAEDAYPE